MTMSFAFRQSFQRRSLHTRRMQVVLFCFWVAALLATAGAPLRGGRLIALRLLPIVSLFSILTSDRPARRGILVTSLDDRATLKYGADFNALTPDQQTDILAGYRVGTYLFPYTGGEAEKESIALSTLRAHSILRRSLLPFLLLYWAGWELLPSGYLRACWTDAPVVLGALIAVILGLPHLLHLWTWREGSTTIVQAPSSATT